MVTDIVIVTEVSLRDGPQIEPVIPPTSDKVTFAGELINVGFKELEADAFVHLTKVPVQALANRTTELQNGQAKILYTMSQVAPKTILTLINEVADNDATKAHS